MFKIKKQIGKLYASSVLSNLSLTDAWVAILAARGFSLPEIGLAETAYHAETGLDRETFLRHLTDGSAEQELESDLLLARNLGIHALPAFWLTGGNKGMLLPFLTDADALSRVIDQIIEAEEMHDAANGIS